MKKLLVSLKQDTFPSPLSSSIHRKGEDGSETNPLRKISSLQVGHRWRFRQQWLEQVLLSLRSFLLIPEQLLWPPPMERITLVPLHVLLVYLSPPTPPNRTSWGLLEYNATTRSGPNQRSKCGSYIIWEKLYCLCGKTSTPLKRSSAAKTCPAFSKWRCFRSART